MGTVKASYKAFTFNKISDCCILLAILLIHQMNQSVNINQFNETICTYAQTDLNLLHQKLPAINSLTYLFMIAAFIKSAQFGFHI
jgi:NADH:ubiquinone oxidoreductase subunit 5 (subunit L)/multisubunit Na+/H+ antiporter MnhA subunit